jgi:hypothetical protein
MPIKRPEKKKKPKLKAGTKHPSAYVGTRLIPSLSMSPANLLQLQQTVGNGFVANLLKEQWKVVQTARRDRVEIVAGSKSEETMAEHPRFGDWHYQYVIDSRSKKTVLYWITLNNYKNRQRHVLIDPTTVTPHEVLGNDLSSVERQALMEWAMQLFFEQMSGNLKSNKPTTSSTSNKTSTIEEEEIQVVVNGSDGSDDE